MNQNHPIAAALVIGLAFAADARADLWVPDSEGDRIMKFSSFDGSVIDLDFITNASTGNRLILPFEPLLVGDEGWVSDQNADAIYRFSLDGTFLGSFVDDDPGGMAQADLVNIRGFEVLDGKLFVANRDSRIPGVLPGGGSEGDDTPSVNIFDVATGQSLGEVSPPPAEQPYDLVSFEGGLLYADPANISIFPGQDQGFVQRLDADGNFVDTFISGTGDTDTSNGLRGPHQILVLPNGNVMVANTTGSPFGVYELDSDGNIVTVYDTVAAGRTFRPEGLALLGNGDIFVTGTDRGGQFSDFNGVFSLDRDTGLFTPILRGVDLGGVRFTPMYANVVPEPAAALSLAVALAAACGRRPRVRRWRA